MEIKKLGQFDIAVIGAGHAGCEAALACSRMGKKTIVFSINLEAVANMFCNPAIGGTGKGHLVREIDALGGEMGLCIDKTFIQSRMLNTAKGPAVHSLRAQADKVRYHDEMKHTLELQENLLLRQGEVIDIDFGQLDVPGVGISSERKVRGVLLRTGAYYGCKACVIATGIMVDAALQAAEILAAEGLEVRVVDMHTIKPLDKAEVLAAAKECGAIVTAEEHSVIGGLGSAVAEAVCGEAPCKVKAIGVQDVFGQSGKPDELLKAYGLTAEDIAAAVRELVGKS